MKIQYIISMLYYEYWRKKNDIYYPAVFTPHKNDKGYHVTFPDLQCCEADGPDLEDAVEHARKRPTTGSIWRLRRKPLSFLPRPMWRYQSGGRRVSETHYGDSEAAPG